MKTFSSKKYFKLLFRQININIYIWMFTPFTVNRRLANMLMLEKAGEETGE